MEKGINFTDSNQRSENNEVIVQNEKIKEREGYINYLEDLYNVVSEILPNSEESNKQELEFYEKVKQLTTLGFSYTNYLKEHVQELSDEEFKAIVVMAKSSFLLNLKVFKNSEERELELFRKSHKDFDILNQPGTDQESWKGIKMYLYNSEFNDVREQFREKILQKAQKNMDKFDMRNGEHLERFLSLPTDGSLDQAVQSYIKNNQERVERWAQLNIQQFVKLLLEVTKDSDTPLVDDPELRRIEEEMASIKPNHLKNIGSKVNFLNRAEKIKLIRDFRFGRITRDQLNEQLLAYENEITNDPNLGKFLGPLLRQKAIDFKNYLVDSKDMKPEERKKYLISIIDSYNLAPESREKVIDFISNRIK